MLTSVLLYALLSVSAQVTLAKRAGETEVAALPSLADVCKACEWGVRSVEDFVADPAHQRKLEGVLDATLCASKGGNERSKCESYVHIAVRRAVQTVEDYASPAALCRPVCPRKPDVTDAVAVDTSLQSWKCPFCEFLAAQADKALADAKTDKEILDFMRQECKDLPESFAAPCVHYVDTEGQLLIALLETLPPEKVCETLGACDQGVFLNALLATPPPADLAADVAHLLADLGSVKVARTCAAMRPTTLKDAIEELGAGRTVAVAADPPSEECQICKVAVNEARLKVADPSFQAAIEKYIEQSLCKEAGDYEELCKDSVQQYAPLAFAMALQYLQPSYVCTTLTHVCPKPPDAAAVAP